MKIRFKFIKIFLYLTLIYFALPFFAGCFKIGDREGPIIYSKAYHSNSYQSAHELIYSEKARGNFKWFFTDRPYFYGFSRRAKSAEEKAEILHQLKETNPLLYELFK